MAATSAVAAEIFSAGGAQLGATIGAQAGAAAAGTSLSAAMAHAGAITAAGAAGAGVLNAAAQGAGAAAASAVLGGVLGPKAPELKAPTPMPDPLEQQKARERSIIEQMARRGRSASILTTPASGGTLGGT